MNTLILTIPHKDQRYQTVGDYFSSAHGVTIQVSKLGDWRMEFLVAVHEMIEEALTRHRGIQEPDIMAFDVAHPDLDDPGMDPRAPYHREHVLATAVEMLLAQELGVDWVQYGEAMEKVLQKG